MRVITLLSLAYLGVILLAFISWGMNIYKLTELSIVASTEFIIRVVGIFVMPLGVILGWIGHF